ncbi:MAG: hypothetical protein JSW10_09680 [Pseudomonadota bacterium]|nr:MAG: hypothetical protein JSW10_09680 [Pseudomonadota bacterium]
MPTVELVYDRDCPNISAAREQLLRAFSALNLTPQWREWEVNDPRTPAHAHGFGSPTVLVDGADVVPDAPTGTDVCCRIYANADNGNRGVPSLDDITAALRHAAPNTPAGGNTGGHNTAWRSNLALLPAVGTALLPKLACPACWPAYAGLLSSLGLGFVDYTPYLLPLTLVFLVIALGALGLRAHTRRGYGPLLLGLTASLPIVVGKFVYDSDAAMYTGLVLLVGASLWNTWPRRTAAPSGCPSCALNDASPAGQ